MSQFKYVVISCTDSCLQSTTRVILRTHGGLANHSFVFEALSSWNCLLHTHFFYLNSKLILFNDPFHQLFNDDYVYRASELWMGWGAIEKG